MHAFITPIIGLRRLLLGLVVVFFTVAFQIKLKAQDTVSVDFICPGSVPLGEQVCVPVTVSGFTNIASFSLAITWDAFVLRFVTLQNEHFSGGLNLPGPDDFRYIWWDGGAMGQNRPDGTVLFELCFDAIGPPGSSTMVEVIPVALSPVLTTEFVTPASMSIPYTASPCDIQITNPLSLTAIITSCGASGGGNGTMMITAYGGTAPYTYSWTGPANGSGNLGTEGVQATEMLPPGTYTVTLMDVAGGSAVYTIQIAAQPLMPQITIMTQPSCESFNNGRIVVGAPSGALPIGVFWRNLQNPDYRGSGTLFTNGSQLNITSLPVGDYEIILIDANGCVVTDTVSLFADPIVVQATPSNATCLGSADGSVSITFSGGIPIGGNTYSVTTSWGATGTVPSPVMSGAVLEPGEHWIMVCDNIPGCCVTETFIVGSNQAITATIQTTAITCPGTADGNAIIAGLVNGIPGGSFTFELYDANHQPMGIPVTNVSSVNYSDLIEGMYNVVIKQGNCRSDSLTFFIDSADSIFIDLLTVTEKGCLPNLGGQIIVDATGGTPGYSFDWMGASGSYSGSSIMVATSGNYMLTVTDSQGCTETLSVNVPQAVSPDILDIVPLNLSCNADSVILEVIFTEGSNPVNYIQWSTGATTPVTTGAIPGTTVNVTVRDSLFCFDFQSYDVPAVGMLNIDSTEVQHPSCPGDGDGHFTVFLNPANGPYTYAWSTGDTTTTNLLPGLGAGIYSVTVFDASMCSAELSIVLEDPESLGFDFSNIGDVSCPERCDGTARLIAFGGDPLLPFQHYWTSGFSDTGFVSIPQDLCAGWQTVTISQNGLCFYTDSVFIDSPEPVGIGLLDKDDVSCFGGSDGQINVSGSGGTGPYTYTWDILPDGPAHNGLASGTYHLTITDSEGCEHTEAVSIQQPELLVLMIDSSNFRPVSCNQPNSGIVGVLAAGGNGGFQYTWDPPISTQSIASALTQGTYNITVTDAAGCTATTGITLTAPEPVVAFLPEIDDLLCFGDLSMVTVDSASGGVGGYTWSVNFGQPHALGEIVMLPAGIYNIIVSDTAGCNDTVQFFLENPPPLQIIIDPPNPIVRLGDSIRLALMLNGTTGQIVTVEWSQNGPLSCYDCIDPFATNVTATWYTVTVWDELGCSATIDILVEVDADRKVFVPNVFSPNQDGVNEEFRVFTGQGVTGIPSARIFDRWGALMVEQTDLMPDAGGAIVWDGTFNGKPMMPGVYLYVIEVLFADNQRLVYHGDVTLLR